MKVAVWGANGKMGKEVVALCLERGYDVVAVDKQTNVDDLPKVDVVIDFSSPSATKNVAFYCKKNGCALVCGVTALKSEQLQLLRQLSTTNKVAVSSNFSVGIDIVKRLCLVAMQYAKGWDCNVVEIHHANKVDSPSGTAIEIANMLQRDGVLPQICVLRSGTECGTHTVIFGGKGESVTITHHAQNKKIFALGALKQAENFCKDKT